MAQGLFVGPSNTLAEYSRRSLHVYGGDTWSNTPERTLHALDVSLSGNDLTTYKGSKLFSCTVVRAARYY